MAPARYSDHEELLKRAFVLQGEEAVKERNVSVILLSGGQGKRMGVNVLSDVLNLALVIGCCSEVCVLGVSCVLLWVRFISLIILVGNITAVLQLLIHIVMV